MKIKAKKNKKDNNVVPQTYANPFEGVTPIDRPGVKLDPIDPPTPKGKGIRNKPQKPKKKVDNSKPKEKGDNSKPKGDNKPGFLEPGNISTQGLTSSFPAFESGGSEGGNNMYILLGVVVLSAVGYFLYRRSKNDKK